MTERKLHFSYRLRFNFILISMASEANWFLTSKKWSLVCINLLTPPPPRFRRLWSLLIKLMKLSVATCISHLPIVRGPESTRVLVTQGPWYVRVQKMLTEFDYFLNSGCWFICVVCIIYQHECVYTYILSGPIQSLDLAS